MRTPRRSGAALASVGVGRVELLARGRWHPPPPASVGTRIIAVGSTGGRVGKSTVAAHLAVAIANLGAHVVAVDLDPRTPSLHGILGVERPTQGWQALLSEEIQDLDSSLTSTTIRNLYLVAGGARSGGAVRLGATPLDSDQRRLLVRRLRALDADVVILDLCAFNHEDLADFFSLAETSLLVTSPAHSSLAASLGFLAQATRPDAAGARLAIKLVGNQASTAEEVEIFHAFSRLARAKLAIELPVVGCVRVQDRLTQLRPWARAPLREVGLDRNGRTFLRMAEYLLHEELPAAPDEVAAGSAPAVAAAGDPPARTEIPGEPLGSMLDRYRRKHLRHEVDWAATLRIAGREIAVRVVDLSLSGAAIEVAPDLEIGADATLRFDQLPDQPALPVVIKSLQEGIRRAGIAFSGALEARERLMATAQAAPACAIDAAGDITTREPASGAADDGP